MNEVLIRIGGVPVYGFGVLAVFAFLWGSFVFFKRAVEENFEDRGVLDCIVLSGFWGFIVGRLAFAILNLETFWNHWSRIFLLTNYPGIDRWGAIIGFALGTILMLRKIKAKFLDWFDLISLGITAGMAVFFAGMAALAFVWQLLIFAVIFLVVFIVLWKAEDSYRTLEWYRNKKTSAKTGFITGFSISAWGLGFLLENILLKTVSLISVLWSVGLFVAGLVLVYIRSGRTVKDDIKNILKHGKR